MNLTDYETSKELKELGFETECEWCWEEGNEDGGFWSIDYEIKPWNMKKDIIYYRAYDLETIFNAMPVIIEDASDTFLHLWMWQDGVGYYESLKDDYNYDMDHHDYELSNDNTGDNLATTAAKLFIKLLKEGKAKV